MTRTGNYLRGISKGHVGRCMAASDLNRERSVVILKAPIYQGNALSGYLTRPVHRDEGGSRQFMRGPSKTVALYEIKLSYDVSWENVVGDAEM